MEISNNNLVQNVNSIDDNNSRDINKENSEESDNEDDNNHNDEGSNNMHDNYDNNNEESSNNNKKNEELKNEIVKIFKIRSDKKMFKIYIKNYSKSEEPKTLACIEFLPENCHLQMMIWKNNDICSNCKNKIKYEIEEYDNYKN